MFEYKIRRYRKSKRIKISVNASGEVRVSAPMRARASEIEGFVERSKSWILESIEKFKNKYGNDSSASVLLRHGSRVEYLKNKTAAQTFAEEQVKRLNAFYGFTYGEISIKNQKSRWGSCSRKGNLNFNYKIVLLPLELAEYIIVHELCHLREFNHGPKFWALVAQRVPNYKEVRRRLRGGIVG